MNESANAFSKTDRARDSVATIPPRWQPWLRGLWAFVAVTSIYTFAWMIYLTRQFADNLPARVADGLNGMGWSVDFYFWFHFALMLLAFICYFGIGAAIFFLRPDDRMAWFASIVLMAYGAEITYPVAAEFTASWKNATLLFGIPYFVNNLFAWGFFIALLMLFPDGRFVPRWSRWIALYAFCVSFGFGLFPAEFGAMQGPLIAVVLGSATLMFVGTLYAQVWRFRNYSTSLQRQQTKWLIYALALIVFFVLIVSVFVYWLFPTSQVSPEFSVTIDLAYFIANLAFVLLPLSIGIAIVRYRLWDIDVIIRKTLTYGLVVALLLVVYFGVVILLQRIFIGIIGTESEIITVLSTLAIAALFVPLRHRIQELLDKRFYRKKYDAQQVLQKFSETVRDETDLEKLTAELVNVVQETMQPTSVSVWLTRNKGKIRDS